MYNCVAINFIHWRSLQLQGISLYTLNNSTIAWHSNLHKTIFKFRSISTYILNKYTLAWHSILHIKKLYTCVTFHRTHCSNLPLHDIAPYSPKKSTFAWHYTLKNEEIHVQYALKKLTILWDSKLRIKKLWMFLALHFTQCRFLQLHGISNYTSKKFTIVWHSIWYTR